MASSQNKQCSNSPAQTLSERTSQDTHLLVWDTLRISANLAVSALNLTCSSTEIIEPSVSSAGSYISMFDSGKLGLVEQEIVGSNLRLLCCEEINGWRWKYVAENDGMGRLKRNYLRAVSLQIPQAPVEELMAFIKSYVVPEGFPESVTPSYVPYMTWRALKHLFGGAMGVFTTKTLLSSVGISKSKAIPGAVAINWILKDGAGRFGKMLFARQGQKFDYDLKQLRFSGDLLLLLGAGVELATAVVPHLFLPLACTANVAKNVAAMTSTSTRTPIYKAFSKGENIGDVTAKGECVGNIADLLGTGLGILVTRRNPSLVTIFSLLSCGYLISSYKEVKSVVLHTLNRARFSVAVESFLETGHIPSLQEGNIGECIFSVPWLKDDSIIIGPRFKDAFHDPTVYLAVESIFQKEQYMVTYNASKEKVYALLKDQAKSDDIIKAAFHAYVLFHSIHSSTQHCSSIQKDPGFSDRNLLDTNVHILEAHIADSCKTVSALYTPFKTKAAEQGWKMSGTLLNPGRARLISMC